MSEDVKKFAVGDIVFIKDLRGSRGASLDEPDDLVSEGIITKVGRRYITVVPHKGRHFRETRFDLTRDLRQVTEYTPSLSFHTSKEEILEQVAYEKIKAEVSRFFYGHYAGHLSHDQLKRVKAIIDEGKEETK